MASMQFCRPEEEIYYEEQQQYISHAQPPPTYGAGYQMGACGHNQGQHMGFRSQHGHNKGQHMGCGQHVTHPGQVHDHHMAGPGMLMQTPGHQEHQMGNHQTPGHQMGNHCGSMEHQNQGHGYEMGSGHLGQVFGGHAKQHEHDGMAKCGKGEKKMKEKKNKKNKKKEKKNKKDDSSSSDSD